MNTLKHWKTLDEHLVAENPWWEYRLRHFEIGDGVSREYHYVHTRGSSMVVPLNPAGKLMLVKQYRYLNDRESWEFPCGGVKVGSSFTQTALEELREETGCEAKNLTAIGVFNPCNGVVDELCSVYLATELQPNPRAGDVTEEFEVASVSAEAFRGMVQAREIWDGMTLAAWAMALPYL
jgi:ADP-ribose pyrophosphatase